MGIIERKRTWWGTHYSWDTTQWKRRRWRCASKYWKEHFLVPRPGCSIRKRQSKIILSPKILNSSSYSHSENQKRSILIKRLKYTSTSKRNITDLKKYAIEFTRKLRLIEMFSFEEKEIENEVDISFIKAKSYFHPPRNWNACLDKTIDFLQQQTFQVSCNK